MDDFRVALLRAVNLGPHGKVAMADLRAMATDLGFDEVKTILNSGNLVFRSKMPAKKLEGTLEAESIERLGLDTEYFVRTGTELARIVSANPFSDFAKRDPAHLVVHFCKAAPGTRLAVKGQNREEIKTRSREIYVTYPDSIGTSKLKLDVFSTARNWNTVLKLLALADAG